ncbi:MAG: hypothetical protein EHM68_11975, partial [Lysobacterales bacterium]
MEENAAPQQDVADESPAYAFGPFTLAVDQGALLRDGVSVPLRPKSFDVLLYLVRHPGRLVRREELLAAAWPGVLVTDDSLTQCLIEIRKALGDRERKIVRTVPRRGYLFDLAVRVVERVEKPGQPAAAAQHDPPAALPRSFARLPSRWTVAALLVLAVAVGATWWRAGAHPETADPPLRERGPAGMSIAVLPFVDMSPEGDQEYLGDGIAEEILNLLAQVQGLTVIARTSSFSFKGEKADIGTIARRLNVAHVLEGSVRKAGERVRVTAQLVDGASGAHIWSQTFDERLQDIFATQDAIARNVATVLQERLLGAAEAGRLYDSKPAKPIDLQAWEAYLRGKYFYGRRMQGDVLRAQQHFEQALAKDPGLAVAWVALAATYNVRMGDAAPADEEYLAPEVALPLMKEALGKALALDPGNPEALLRMSWFIAAAGDREGAIDQMEQAMRSGRNHALVQSMLGGLALGIGDPLTAAALQRRAAMLDPVSTVHLTNLGHFLYAAGRLDEADSAFLRAAELNPETAAENLGARVWIAIHHQEFAVAAELGAQLPPGLERDQAEAMLGFQSGEREAADAALARLLQSPEAAAAVSLVQVYAFRGEAGEAFRWIGRATDHLVSYGDRWWSRHAFFEFRASPFLLPLHDDPRWADWLAETRQRLHRKEDERVA